MNKSYFNPTYDQIKHQLFIIFTYYCGFGDRNTYNKLKIQNFRKLFEDAQLIQTAKDNIKTDLLFSGKKKDDGISFDTFLGVVPQLARKNGHIQAENVKNIVNSNLHALYEYLMQETDFGQ